MNAEPNQAKAIFLEAVEKHDPDGWPAYLDQACAGQPDLRHRVEVLLGAHREAGTAQHQGAGIGPIPVAVSSSAERPGTVIGAYKLLQQIGEGGMGTVFMAEQTHPVQRKVALKVIKPGMDSQQVIARFEAERQALAMMDHVNIARVLDAGTVGPVCRTGPDAESPARQAGPTGRPYFVMELVHGVPITKYCDDNHLTPRERLELFVPVCQAIQHAHQKGIIHRDIKPSNVMITLYDGKPVPKVIDFGVAKATEQKLTERTLFTQYGSMVGTPQYMSPEQAEMSALGVDTRSDIFSLGVLLYELLTGSTPLSQKRLKEAAYGEVLRMIKEEEAPRPSTRLSDSGETLASISAQRHMEPAKLTKLVRGELDWIVMKALEKDRNRRYETASAFAADVRRYLGDEPVLACPPSAWYRFSKFARRNKGRLAIAGLVLFFLVLLGGGTGWVARDQAVRRVVLENEVAGALEETRGFLRRDRLPEALATVKRAEALLAGGGREGLRQRVSRLRADVEMAARLEDVRLQKAAVKDGTIDSAAADQRYRSAFRDYDLDVAALGVDEAAERIQASAIEGQLLAALDDWLLTRNDLNLPDGAGLLAVVQRADADSWRRQFRQAFQHRDNKALKDLARDQRVTGQPPATLTFLGALLIAAGERGLAIEVLRAAQQQHPNDFWINQDLGKNLVDSGEAVRYFQAGLALRPDSAGAHLNLGIALCAKGDLAGAIAAHRTAIALQPRFANAHSYLGNALCAKGDLAGAVAACRQAIALKPDNTADLATAHNSLGIALRAKGDLAGAIAAYQKAIALQPKFANAHSNLGNALHTKGDLTGAIAAYQKAIALQPKFAEAHSNLGIALRDQGDLAGAIAACRKAIALEPDNPADLAKAYSNLGNILHDQNDLDGAIAACHKAIALKPDLATAHINLGIALRDKGDLDDAITACRKAIALEPGNSADLFKAHSNLGNALRDKGDLDGAIAAYQKAIALKPDNPADLAKAYSNLGGALRAKGDPAGAIAAHRMAIALQPKFAGAHSNLAIALHAKGDLVGAVAAHRMAVALQPKLADAHYGLGNALRDQGDLAGASAAYQMAIALEPNFAEPHCNLGLLLRRQGEFRKALGALCRGHELGSRRRGWHYPSARWVQSCERLVELDGQLTGFLDGKATPASADERIELAELCSLKRLHRAAVRFYEEAFAAEPKLLTEHRYNAACATALAGCGQGENAARLADRERERLRSQALSWLRDDLTQGTKQWKSNPAVVQRALRSWQRDPDLAGVRDPGPLAKLPPSEQEAWRRLWAEVAKAMAPDAETR